MDPRMVLLGGMIASALVGPAPGLAETPAQMDANKKVVLEFYRNVWEPQRLDAMKDYYDPDIIEHNPNVKSGISGFAETMGRRWVPKPIEARLKAPPAMVLADGDTVTLVFRRPRPDPADPARTYDTYWFDLFRLKNGKVVEHWDAATRPAASPGAPRP